MTLRLRYGARSDVGLLRDGNEDAMYAGPRLLAIADGMGGHAAGEVASRVVIEAVARLDQEPAGSDLTDALQRAVDEANQYLRDMVSADGALEGMGTTLTALLWDDGRLALGHVGDSRGYLFRDGRIEPITHDHTLVQNLIDEGRITAEEATTHPQRSWITRALDGRPDATLDLSMREVRAGDRYLLCSDGLSSYVSEETLADALGEPDPQLACDRLVELALRAGGPDNITCIVADIVDDSGDDAEPIVGGAAADDPDTRLPSDSPAARAAAVQSAPAAAPAAPPAAAPATPSPPPRTDADAAPAPSAGRGASRRVVLVLVLVLLLVGLGVLGTFLYARTQYYVAPSTTIPRTVTIYRGVSGSLLGVDLSRVEQHTDLPVSALPPFRRSQVHNGIDAKNAADARRIVATLRTETCSNLPTGTRKKPAPPPPAYCRGAG